MRQGGGEPADHRTVSARLKSWVLVVTAVAVIAGAVFANGRTQRDALTHSLRETVAAHDMLTAMLDQETGLRGYLQTRRRDFLEPFHRGGRAFARAVADARGGAARDERDEQRAIDRIELVGERWRREAEDALAADALRRGTGERPVPGAVHRKQLMDALRREVAGLQRLVAGQRERRLDAADRLAVALVVGLSALFAGAGWLVLGRRAVREERRLRHDRHRREHQTAFASTLALMDSEAETNGLLKRHLERAVPGSEVHILNRDASAARLEAATPVGDGSPLATALADANPRSCLAVRLGHRFEGGDEDALLSCALCSSAGRRRTTCSPLLVSGEVIGSVLAAHDDALPAAERAVVTESVTQAAPVLANMRNLAVAERRAATDVLTGLPNRRLAQETLKRLVAHAARTGTSLSAIAVDVDHFKQVNDVHGHDVGDQVLAAVGRALAGTLRASDFVARVGGEEFIALLPDTDADGGMTAAEHLRDALRAIALPGVQRTITASFGVATFPDDARDPETLLKLADRALYAAKDHGRDRVHTARSGVPA